MQRGAQRWPRRHASVTKKFITSALSASLVADTSPRLAAHSSLVMTRLLMARGAGPAAVGRAEALLQATRGTGRKRAGAARVCAR